MTEREKRIITLFSKYSALSKKELAEREGFSWATAVKQISRLQQAGILQCVGSDAQPEITGKNPLLYDLADRLPLAIGIDVSYATTSIILTNLKKTILHQETYPTIKNPTLSQLQDFLITICLDFAQQHLTEEDALEGIGIGIPLWLVSGNHLIISSLRKSLAAALHTDVEIENNVRSYTLYKKWAGKAFSLDDFLLITIRGGIGAGIFCQGDLLRGAHGLAGEISHLTVHEGGPICRCGKRGCLETLVNRDILYQEYVQHVLQRPENESSSSSETDIHQGLTDLFSLAKQGEPQAAAIVQRAARYLSIGLAALLLTLDSPHIIIIADFGPDGDALLPPLRQEIQQRVIAGIDYTIAYYPLDRLGFARGAALLILKEYFTEL